MAARVTREGDAAKARALAALPDAEREAAIALALAEAREGSVLPPIPGLRAFAARLRQRVAEAVEAGRPAAVALDHSALSCPGLPWHVAVDGEVLLDGRYALPVADVVVAALLDAGWLAPVPGRDARLVPTPTGALALGIPDAPSQVPSVVTRAGLRTVPRMRHPVRAA